MKTENAATVRWIMRQVSAALVLIFILLFSFSAFAQTNAAPAVSPVPEDIARLIHDICPNISISTVIQAIAGIFFLARILRKGVPDNWQVGKLGTVLSHLALEVNPDTSAPPATSTPPPAAAAKPA